MKKFLALLLALMMVLGMVACGTTTETTETETKEETKTETTETTETKEETKEEETTEETTEEEWPMIQASALCFTSTGFTPKAESMGVDYYRENWGLDLEVLPVDISTDESWNIFWAGGGYADIILPYGGTQARQIVAEGICRTIEFDWIKEYMPRMYTLLGMCWGDDENILKNLNINGETYCIPYFGGTTCISFNTGYRADWMENLGLEVPTTVEELEEIVRAFAEDDPDGNGVDDTYAFTGNTSYGVYNLAAAYGTSGATSFWKNADETAMTTNIDTDEYRAYLSTLAKWYANGWIDPEYLTDGRTEARSKFANGTTGVYSDNPWWWENDRGEVGPLAMLSATQGLDYATCCVYGTGLENVYTGDVALNAGYGWINGQASIYFGYETSDEIVIRMMQIIDKAVRLYTFDEEDKAAIYEMAKRTSGIEGQHWQVKEDGRIETLASLTADEQNQLGMYLFPTAAYSDLDAFIGEEDEFVIDLYHQALELDGVIYNSYNCTLPILEGEIGDKYTNVTDYASTSRGQFISGELDINDDAAWETYCATLEELGLNDILAAYEEYFGM